MPDVQERILDFLLEQDEQLVPQHLNHFGDLVFLDLEHDPAVLQRDVIAIAKTSLTQNHGFAVVCRILKFVFSI
jgi:hypothetical protein